MALPIKKLYIDSRHNPPDSVSDSNFKYELPSTISMPQNACFFITDVCMPYLWRTVNKNDNDHIYFSIGLPAPRFPYTLAWLPYVGVIPPASYGEQDFAAALNTVLSTLSGGVLIATIDNNISIVTVSTTNPQPNFRINTDAEVTKYLNISNPTSINKITVNTNSTSATQTASSPYIIKRLNLQKINNVYITSPNLGAFDTPSNFQTTY